MVRETRGRCSHFSARRKLSASFRIFFQPNDIPLWTVVRVTLQSNLLDWPGSKLFICFNNALEWPAAIVVEGLSHSSTGILSLHCLIQWSSLIIQLPHTVPSKLQIHWKWVLSINSVWLIILSEKVKDTSLRIWNSNFTGCSLFLITESSNPTLCHSLKG